MVGNLVSLGQIGKWHLDLKGDGSGTNRVATTYKDGKGYEIETQLEWVAQHEGEVLPEGEQVLMMVVGTSTAVEMVPRGVLEWLMRGVKPADLREGDANRVLVGRVL